MTKVYIEAISKTFSVAGKEIPVLMDVSFQAKDCGVTVVVGESGCGKTTLLRIIAGLEDANRGSVRVVGGTARPIPIVWQDHRLLPWRTVWENVSLPRELKSADEEFGAREISSLIELVGLKGFEDWYIGKLSHGMAARVAVARGLAANSDILLMDEPFAAVDYLRRRLLLREMRALGGQGVSVVYVTHDLGEAVEIGERLVILSARPARVLDVIDPGPDADRAELVVRVETAMLKASSVRKNP